MKLLIAIPSTGNTKTLFSHTMRWVSRTGYDVRVFVPPDELEAYREGARDANHEYYLDIMDGNFISWPLDPPSLKDYAKQNGYDLIIILPDELKRFDRKGTSRGEDMMLLEFVAQVGKARLKLSKKPELDNLKVSNRVKLERVNGEG